MKNDKITITGQVVENLPNTTFRVKLDKQFGEKIILCYLSGKMRKNYIKILPGDRVKIEITPYDPERGRIIYRL